MQLNTLSTEGLSQELTDDVLLQLAQEDDELEALCHLSLNAISGTEGEESIRLRALVKNQVFLLLVDSGSSATFVNSSFVDKAGLTAQKCRPVKVKVANGEEMISDSVVKGVDWLCGGHTFTTDMRVLDLGAYDAILGFDWLKSNSPMTCHWEQKTLEFMNKGVRVKVQGVKQPQ